MGDSEAGMALRASRESLALRSGSPCRLEGAEAGLYPTRLS